jgi:hypothetical protein
MDPTIDMSAVFGEARDGLSADITRDSSRDSATSFDIAPLPPIGRGMRVSAAADARKS